MSGTCPTGLWQLSRAVEWLLQQLHAPITPALALSASPQGPSGSGKSTLLNTLALRLDPGVTLSGDMAINGKPYTNALLKQVRVWLGGEGLGCWQVAERGTGGKVGGCPHVW
jgi:ABC-type transport system involved in cytochrome c biogenesis ATPase subunit